MAEKVITNKDKLLEYNLATKMIVEFIGSFFLVLAAIGPIILFNEVLSADIAIAVIADALAVGFILFALIEIKGPVSGAHFNPIVTFIKLARKELSWLMAITFLIVQILGGFFGMIFAHLMFYQNNPQIITISKISRNNGAYIAEAIGTFLLIFVILLMEQTKTKRASLTIGLLVGGMLLATSSTMFANPQVTIARMFTYSAAGVNPLDGLVFIGMQIIGGTIAALIFYFAIELSSLNKKSRNDISE